MTLTEKVEKERMRLQKLALGALHSSVAHDAADHAANHFLAMCYADMREIDLALLYEQRALTLNPGSGDSWEALALLFSAKKWNLSALQATEAGLRRCPDHTGLLLTQAELELAAGVPSQALRTCLTATTRWREKSEATTAVPVIEDDKHSVVSFRSTVANPADAVIRASLQTDQQQQQQPGNVPSLPTDLCLAIAKAFAALKQWEDARNVLVDQLLVSDNGDKKSVASILNMQGQIAMMQQQTSSPEDSAMAQFEKALSVDPAHVESLMAVAALSRSAGQMVIEEAHVLSVLSIAPLCHGAWVAMGTILRERGSIELATECFLTAARLEETSPVRPFAAIPRSIPL
jgi:Tfp pilus assembly protein PilF